MESLKFLSSIITLVDILENLSTSQQWKSFFKFVFQSHRFLFLAADLYPSTHSLQCYWNFLWEARRGWKSKWKLLWS